jgi:putative ABC transport system substrate-binding protein
MSIHRTLGFLSAIEIAINSYGESSGRKHRNMTAYWFIGLTIMQLATSALALNAQERVYRVGLLIAIPLDRPQFEGLRQGLKDAGYVEGKNLVLLGEPNRTSDELRALAKAYTKQNIDVIVTSGPTETRIAKEATDKIPIVFVPSSDPVRLGVVKSLSNPGTNLTGVTYFRDLRESGKPLEMFKAIVPSLERLLLLIDARAKDPIYPASLKVVRKVAERLAITLIEKPVSSLVEAEQVAFSASKETTDGIHSICSALFGNLVTIGRLARQKLLPLQGCTIERVAEENALFAYASSLYEIGRRGAWYVDRVLKGTRPQDLPVDTPKNIELVINLRVANALGMRVPVEMLQRADRVLR